MSAVVVGGGLIHYEAFGRGHPVVFVHGWLGSWRYWMRTMEALASDYRSYAIDLWGFGDSDKSQERYSIADYSALLCDFMDQLGIANVSLVGHSLGAIVGLRLAAQHRSRISRLTIVSPPLTARAVSSRLFDFDNSSAFTKMFWRRLMIHSEVKQGTDKVANHAIALSLQSALEIDTWALIKQVRQPTLIVYGEKDSLIDPQPVHTLNGQRPGLRPIGFPASQHFPMLEEANRFNRLLKDFLDASDDLSGLALKEEWKRRNR